MAIPARKLLISAGLALLATPALAAPALWEVSDADSKIYVFGSFHILPADAQWRTPVFDEALANSAQVYFETDIGPLGIVALTIKMLSLAFEQRPSWVAGLTAEQTQILTQAITPIGMTLREADLFPPWVTTLRLTMAQPEEDETPSPEDAAKPDFETGQGVEASLYWELPKERKAYFETAAQQFDILAGGSIDQQVADLMQSLGAPDGDAPSDVLGPLFEAWMEGDQEAMALPFVPTDADSAAAVDRILYQRNANWLPAIESMLSSNEQDMVIVGAAHLSGERSVLDLLEQAGYTVTRIQ